MLICSCCVQYLNKKKMFISICMLFLNKRTVNASCLVRANIDASENGVFMKKSFSSNVPISFFFPNVFSQFRNVPFPTHQPDLPYHMAATNRRGWPVRHVKPAIACFPPAVHASARRNMTHSEKVYPPSSA